MSNFLFVETRPPCLSPARSLSLPRSVLPLVVVLLFIFAGAVHADTDPKDKAALLAFKSAVNDSGLMLASWDNSTDPCVDQWRGVLCTCLTDYQDSKGNRIPNCTPPNPGYIGSQSRVLQLNLGDVRIRQWNTLAGDLPASLGDLTALRNLILQNNNFTGAIPWQWYQLTNLEQLNLAGNSISGPLPVFLSNFARLKYVSLQNNNFSGGLPNDWCYGAWWQFDVSNNPHICDELPSCLYDRIISFKGTSLIDPIGNRDGGMGGYCGVQPPTCRKTEDACWVEVPEPAYWTNASSVQFSFPDFPSSEGGQPATYAWRVGTSPGAGDLSDWQPFSGINVTQSAEVSSENETNPKVITQVVHIANGDLPSGVSLRQGDTYYVTVRGSNAAGPLQGIQVVSDPVIVDTTPPVQPPGASVYSSQYYSNALAQTDTNGIGVSWDPFEDPESGVASHAYQVFEYRTQGSTEEPRNYAGDPQTNKVKLKDNTQRDLYISKLNLEPGHSYFTRVFATNGAGLETYKDSPAVAVMKPGEALVVNENINGVAVSKVVIIIAALVGATSAVVAVITFYFARERYRRRQQESRKYRGQMRNLRQLLNSLFERVGDASSGKVDPFAELRKLKNVAFVITDLEGSTKIAAAAPRAYEWVQEAHDALLRDLIAVYGGYEINTEGDAFHVAFKDVATAVHFCMEVQYQLMEMEWPREVLRLPECREIRAPDDSSALAYRGPRVRMGIHWAEEGSVVQHIHALTKHRIFTGPAFQITRELCEAGSGGQVLMTHAAWVRLREHMSAAAFPVVEQLGCFKFSSFSECLWVYQVNRLLAKPLYRPPIKGLQGAEQVEEGAGFAIVGAPTPFTSKGELTFVSCRLALETCSGASNSSSIPFAMHTRLYNVLASCSMQFGGLIFRMSESQGCYLVAFASAVDALRFCHTAQVFLMYAPWPAAECSDWCGEEESAADGKALFKGPRVAMAIHSSNDYSTRPVPRSIKSPEGNATDMHFADYLGPAEEAVRGLSEVAHGGQVILSEPAWKAVQDRLPGQPQVISLGTYALRDPALPGPTMLMEVMPQALARRSFPPPQQGQMVEPGYRDAPSAHGDVAIAQIRVVKPEAVVTAEAARAGITDDAIIRIITAYNVALDRAVRAARSLLRTHGGYECKEPEPGKLTVAFRSLDSAVRWAGAVQLALLEVHWPTEILGWDDCREIRDGEEEEDALGSAFADGEVISHGVLEGIDGVGGELASVAASGHSADGAVIWRGLKVRIGIACGIPASKAPLNTGRADYFGTIPNLAARLMSLAQPGQTLFDGAKLSTLRQVAWRDEVGTLAGNDAFPESIDITSLGQFSIKGLDELRSVYQSLPVALSTRIFQESPALVKPSGASISRRVSSTKATKTVEPEGQLVANESAMVNGGSATARRPGIFSSISRSGSITVATRRLGSGSFSSHGNNILSTIAHLRTHSRNSDNSSDGGAALARPPPDMSADSSNYNFTSKWVARSLLGRRSAKKNGGNSGNNSPKSPHGPYVALEIPTSQSPFGNKQDDAAGGVAASSLGPSSYQSESILVAGQVQSHQSKSLRDVSDWSCPGSRLETPTNPYAADVDHWEEGIGMEAALKVDGLDLPQHEDLPLDPFGSMILDEEVLRRQNNNTNSRSNTVEQQFELIPPRPGLTVQTTSTPKSIPMTKDTASKDESRGLQFAQQIAQLFVDRRRKNITPEKPLLQGTTETSSGMATNPLTSSRQTWLEKLTGTSKESTPSPSPTKKQKKSKSRSSSSPSYQVFQGPASL